MLYLCGFRICGFSLGARFRPVYYTFGTTGRMLTVGFRVLLWMQWNVTWLRGTVQPWWTGVGTPLWQWWERVGTGREPMGMKTKRSWVRMRSGRLKRDSLMRRVSLTRRDSLTRRALINNLIPLVPQAPITINGATPLKMELQCCTCADSGFVDLVWGQGLGQCTIPSVLQGECWLWGLGCCCGCSGMWRGLGEQCSHGGQESAHLCGSGEKG